MLMLPMAGQGIAEKRTGGPGCFLKDGVEILGSAGFGCLFSLRRCYAECSFCHAERSEASGARL